MKEKYRQPLVLHHWVNDIPEGEFYELTILDNGMVCCACGRYAHSSGSAMCTWQEFQVGELNGLVEKTVGSMALIEAKTILLTLIL